MQNKINNTEAKVASGKQIIFKNSSSDMGTIKTKKSFGMNRWILNYAFVALSFLSLIVVPSFNAFSQCPGPAITAVSLTIDDRPC